MEYGIKMYQSKSFGNTDWGDLISGASTQQQIANPLATGGLAKIPRFF